MPNAYAKVDETVKIMTSEDTQDPRCPQETSTQIVYSTQDSTTRKQNEVILPSKDVKSVQNAVVTTAVSTLHISTTTEDDYHHVDCQKKSIHSTCKAV